MKNIVAYMLGASLVLVSLSGCTRDDKSAAPAQSSQAVSAQPNISFDKEVFNYGKVTEGDKVKHVFKVSNTGKAPLEIKRVRASCGCTAVVLKEKKLAPGASTEIEATFDTSRRSGPQKKTITVQSNDPNRPVVRLRLEGVVERILSLSPAIVRLSAEHGKKSEVVSWLRGRLAPKAKLSVEKVSAADGNHVVAEIVHKKDGEHEIQGVKLVLTGGKVDRFDGTVDLKTGLQKPATIVLRYHADVVGNVRLGARALFFNPHNEAGRTNELSVSSKLSGFKLKQAKVIEGPYEATVEEPDSGTGYIVKVRLTKTKGSNKELGGKLLLVTNDVLQPKIEIPLAVRILASAGKGRPLRRIPALFMRGAGLRHKGTLPLRSPKK